MFGKKYIIFWIAATCLLFLQSCENDWTDFDIPGCMDNNASNYDLNANVDNGSCSYSCLSMDNYEQCIDIDCYWWNDSCHSIEEPLQACQDIIDNEICISSGCYWWQNACHESMEPIMIYNIDASDYTEWIYFSLESSNVVDIINPENSLGWDIAFKRNHMITNGGLSGSGLGCAIVDENQEWTDNSFLSSDQIANYECQVDEIVEGNIFTYQGCYNPLAGHIFEDCIKNPALDQWGDFDDSYTFIPVNFQFFIRSANGTNYAFWPIAYEDINGETGQISMTYRVID